MEDKMQHRRPPVEFSVVEYDERFLEASWYWLNDPEARELNQVPVFSREEQRKWFDSLPHRTDYSIWGIEWQRVPIGAMGFRHIEGESAECWTYIGEKSLWGQGIGNWMMQDLLRRARARGLKHLWAGILKKNNRAQRFVEFHGFTQTGDDDCKVRMEIDLAK